MARIRFTRLVISPTYGNCDLGDIIQCSEAFARHCVNDLRAAEYLEVPASKPTPRKRGGKRVTNSNTG